MGVASDGCVEMLHELKDGVATKPQDVLSSSMDGVGAKLNIGRVRAVLK